MKHRRTIFVFVVIALAVFFCAPWNPKFGTHFHFPLPATATLSHSHKDASLESGFEFEFGVTDDALRDAIIKDWDLKPSTDENYVMSFAELPAQPWWPADRLELLHERYGRVDHNTAHYWSVWVDRENGRVYAEYGNW